MTHKDRLTKRVAWFVVLTAAAFGSKTADAQIAISKVSLTLVSGDKREATAGALYKVASDGRSHVADVASDGNTTKPVACNVGDVFEAEAESQLNRPLAPTRHVCDAKMAFNFKRAVLFVGWGDKSVNPLEAPQTGPAIYSNYSTVFANAGQTEAAKATSDAAIAAAAREGLGDTQLEKYVVRDPAQGYRLVLSTYGVAALKQKQASFGLDPTGQLDHATQSVLAKADAYGQGAPIGTVPGMRCMARAGMMGPVVVCAPSDSSISDDPEMGSELIGKGKKARVADLPAIKFKLE